MVIRGQEIVKVFDEEGGCRDCFYIPKNEFGPLKEAMGTDYCEYAHNRTIKEIEVDGKISKKSLR